MRVIHQLPSLTYAAGGNQTVQLRDLPKQVRGRIPHLTKILFDCVLTPTFTAAPTLVGVHNAVAQCDFWDGRLMRFSGGFNTMRYKELFETGRNRVPDVLTSGASTVAKPFRRTLAVGPQNTVGGLSDFMIPTGMLQTGELRVKYGALTDISADTTAATLTIKVFAVLELMDEVRIPPAYQWSQYSAGAADLTLPGKALYHSMLMFNSASFDAFTAGDLGNIRLDLGAGDVVPTIAAQGLTAAYQDDYAPGSLGVFNGDPSSSVDTNGRIVNLGSATAIAAAPLDLQPVLWAMPGQKLTKLELAESAARLQWSGTQSTAIICTGRILPQEQNVIGTLGAEALQAINRTNKGTKIKTFSKKPYGGPLVQYLPYTIAV